MCVFCALLQTLWVIFHKAGCQARSEERRGDITPRPHPSLTPQGAVAESPRYLYHDVDVLGVLQQAEVGVDVEPGLIGVGVGHVHLALPQGLQEGLVPLRLLVRQQRPLKERTTPLEVTRVAAVPTASRKACPKRPRERTFAGFFVF